MVSILKKEIILDKTVCRLCGVSAFVVMIALSAFVRIPLPFTPVPLTLQTMFVLLAGAFLGANLGGITLLSYSLLGVSGVPLFTGAGSGLLYLLGPTGGYLFGFLLAGLFTGKFIKFSGNSFSGTFGLFCLADLLILASGSLWLKLMLKVSLSQSLLIGFLPFVFGDLLKAFAAALVYLKLKNRAKEVF